MILLISTVMCRFWVIYRRMSEKYSNMLKGQKRYCPKNVSNMLFYNKTCNHKTYRK